MNRWDTGALEYTDIDGLKTALVGRSITGTHIEGTDYSRVLIFDLDDGTQLKAHATDGGCACSNGCFTVDPGSTVRGTILNVTVEEAATAWGEEPHPVQPGSLSIGSAVIKLFVYTDLGQSLLVESEGGDNGYYGWGFWLSVEKPSA